MQASWISSMAEFSSIIIPALSIINAKRICEIGASAGTHSQILAEVMKKHQGQLVSIDPRPQQSYLDWLSTSAETASHIKDYSLAVIPQIGKVDAWFLDGDHNWYTVFNELQLIEAEAIKHNYPPLIFLHDMNWPCARRDMYYDPTKIPATYLQPHSSEISISMHHPNTVEGGFKGGIWAIQEGGERNGILTAVEDFAKQSKKNYHWVHIPAILGLGILIAEDHPQAKILVDFYAPYNAHPLLEKLEKDRVEKHLIICNLQDKINKLSAALTSLSKFCET